MDALIRLHAGVQLRRLRHRGTGIVRRATVVRMAGDHPGRSYRGPAHRLAAVRGCLSTRWRAGLATFIDTRLDCRSPQSACCADRSVAASHGRQPAGMAERCADRTGTYTRSVTLSGKQTRAMFVHTVLPGGYNLLVGRDQALFAPLTTRFWYGLAGAVAVLSIAGALGGFMIRRAVLLRVDGIRQAVTAIVQGNLSHRLPTQRSSDELDTLSRTINGMLDQIEPLVHGVRDVSNAIAHDLRTPLAELRSRLEELLLTRPQSEEVFAEIDAAVVDVDRASASSMRCCDWPKSTPACAARDSFPSMPRSSRARRSISSARRGVAADPLAYQGSGQAEVSGDPVCWHRRSAT